MDVVLFGQGAVPGAADVVEGEAIPSDSPADSAPPADPRTP